MQLSAARALLSARQKFQLRVHMAAVGEILQRLSHLNITMNIAICLLSHLFVLWSFSPHPALRHRTSRVGNSFCRFTTFSQFGPAAEVLDDLIPHFQKDASKLYVLTAPFSGSDAPPPPPPPPINPNLLQSEKEGRLKTRRKEILKFPPPED